MHQAYIMILKSDIEENGKKIEKNQNQIQILEKIIIKFYHQIKFSQVMRMTWEKERVCEIIIYER